MSVQPNTDADAQPVRLSEAQLRETCTALVAAFKVPAADAAQMVDVFLQAELMGEESHGLRLFVQVVRRLRDGGDRAVLAVTPVMDRGAVALWDADRSLGQVVAARAMRTAIEKARAQGIGLVSVRNCNSFTSAKYYPLLAAGAGMIGAAFTNTSRKLMPPPGGITPVLGNNPVAWAAPAGRHGAWVFDMACTEAAVERIVKAKERGEEIPAGWALDKDGHETRDAAQALESLSLLPFGGYKAFNLASVHEILTSVLAAGQLFAGDATGFLPYDRPMNTSFTLMAIDISAFQPVTEFETRMEAMIAAIKDARQPEGSREAIRFPGERSLQEMARRKVDGVPLARTTWLDINRLAQEAGTGALPPA